MIPSSIPTDAPRGALEDQTPRAGSSAKRIVGVVLAALAAVAIVIGLGYWPTSDQHPPQAAGSFAWLTRTTPPFGWSLLAPPSGLGAVWVPPGFHVVGGDRGTLSVARVDSAGNDLGYLNVTPRQGDESLRGWAAFRLAHLREDDAIAAREDDAIESLRTGSGVRSCVVDDYVTRVDQHRFHEVACLVMSGRTGSAVVAAVPSGDPAHVWNELERSVALYP